MKSNVSEEHRESYHSKTSMWICCRTTWSDFHVSFRCRETADAGTYSETVKAKEVFL